MYFPACFYDQSKEVSLLLYWVMTQHKHHHMILITNKRSHKRNNKRDWEYFYFLLTADNLVDGHHHGEPHQVWGQQDQLVPGGPVLPAAQVVLLAPDVTVRGGHPRASLILTEIAGQGGERGEQ